MIYCGKFHLEFKHCISSMTFDPHMVAILKSIRNSSAISVLQSSYQCCQTMNKVDRFMHKFNFCAVMNYYDIEKQLQMVLEIFIIMLAS